MDENVSLKDVAGEICSRKAFKKRSSVSSLSVCDFKMHIKRFAFKFSLQVLVIWLSILEFDREI